MSEELELKYAVDDPGALIDWLDDQFPPTRARRWRTVQIEDRYFDTADGALAAARIGARLRTVGRATTLTFKSDIEVRDALHRRLELEAPVTPMLDPAGWPASEARDRLLAVTGERRLVERFVVRQRRRERQVKVGRSTLGFSVDEGEVELAGAPAGVMRQLEVELFEGSPAALRRVDAAVRADAPARPESRSKLVIAAEMAAARAVVAAHDSLAVGGRVILRTHLVRLLDREIRVRAGDQLALKQMRVATRRMRATWRIFGDGFKRSVVRRHVAELRTVARGLGEVRDLDVLISGLPATAGLQPLAQEWRARREQAGERMMEFLDSDAYRRFVDDHLSLTADRGAGVARRGAAVTIGEVAPERISAGHRRMLDAGAVALSDGDDAAWHALRIAAKRLRYTLEAFRPLLEQQSTTALIERLVRVQDHLGEMNDASVAAAALEQWAATAQGGEEEAAAIALAGDRRRQVARLRRSFESAWRGVSGVTFDRLLRR